MATMGDRIKQKRKEHGLTLEELADKLGLKKSAISKWERGAVENIKRATIDKLCTILECSPQWLMGWEDNPTQEQLIADYEATKKAYLDFKVDNTDIKLIQISHNLSESKREQLIAYAQFMAQNND